MRVKNGKLMPGNNWYFSGPEKTEEPPVIESTVAEAVTLIAKAVDRSPNTVYNVVYVDYRPDGLVDVTAFGRLIRLRPSTPREKRKAAKRLADQTAVASEPSAVAS